MNIDLNLASTPHAPGHRLARIVLASFLGTFVVARLVVFLMMSRYVPDIVLRLGDSHVHHLSYGIILLALVAGYSTLARPHGRKQAVAAVLYGIALALTFDEFGLWINLGGSYWQRASVLAVIAVGALLTLASFHPLLWRLRARHWAVVTVLMAAVVVSSLWVARAVREDTIQIGELLRHVERTGPL